MAIRYFSMEIRKGAHMRHGLGDYTVNQDISIVQMYTVECACYIGDLSFPIMGYLFIYKRVILHGRVRQHSGKEQKF